MEASADPQHHTGQSSSLVTSRIIYFQENIAANFLFKSDWRSPGVPRWKFELGLEVGQWESVSSLVKLPYVQIARAEDPLVQQKAELMFKDDIPRWKVEMVARCTAEWQVASLIRFFKCVIDSLVLVGTCVCCP